MELAGITYIGPPFAELPPVLATLPDDLAGLLRQINGFILFEGNAV